MKPLAQESLLFFLFVFSSSCYFVTGNDTQQLISFKLALPNPNLLPTWQSNQDPCYFNGVSCKQSRVSSVDLSTLPLNIDFLQLSSRLFSLPYLETLSLKNTNLTGNISSFSPGISCSPVLAQLDLAENHLTGSVTGISSLSSCKSLKHLNLSRNSFGYDDSWRKETRAKFDLESLDISRNGMTAQNVVEWVVSVSGGCALLKVLNLEGNKISGSVPVSVSSCMSLEYLDISSNNFTGEIPYFPSCENLQHLDVSQNKFTGVIGKQVVNCANLSYFNASMNKLSGEIPVFSSGSLKYLLLSSNQFQGELPEKLGRACETLIELDVSTNNLRGKVPEALASCSVLATLNLSTNNFSGELPTETFLKMTSLKKLILSYNNFVGSLPDSYSQINSLELLDLSSNNISGYIPAGLCQDVNKSSLTGLFLANNRLIGTIPPALSNCSELVTLDLSFNYLTGTIPPSLGSLTNLKDLIMWLNLLSGEIPDELRYIKSLENLILDNNAFTGVIPPGLSNCTNLNWISLSSNRLTGEIPAWIGGLTSLAILKLGNNTFSGGIPPEIGDCKSLIWLDLNSNRLSGSIPSTIAKQAGNVAVGLISGKRFVYLKNDGSADCHGAGNLLEFAGIRPEGLDRVPTRRSCNFTRVYFGNAQYNFNNNGSMIFLDLSYNKLDNSIPKELGRMYYLQLLNLGHNSLSGPIPDDLGNLKNVGILDISHNKLEGSIPNSLSGLTLLSEIDLSNNNLSGPIPESGQLALFPPLRYENNTGLCGIPLSPCSDTDGNASKDHRSQKSHRRQASLAGSVAMGLLFSVFCIFGVIIVIVERRKRKKKERALENFIDSRSQSGNGNASNWKLTNHREALSINLSTFEKPLRKLTFADLLEATNGFHNDSMIGSGGFGDVYRAQLKDGTVVAVKKLIQVSGQGDREFTAEMETIGKVKHRNLVPLLGYCKVGEERLLVYEYMRFGSLEDILHDRRKAGIKLNWAARRKIAIGSARGLAFLHHNCIPHIIHRDMKSSNVLLDENLEARVSDFGMARLMSAVDTHLSVSTLAGTPGYVPPEYYQSFQCSTKGDVYSYGVVLLELLTGKQPIDSEDFGDNNLVGWVKQHAKLKISDVFDPELMKEDPSLEIELLQHLKVACACLEDRPRRRPTMIQVMAMFKDIQAGGSGMDSSTATEDEDGIFNVLEVVEMSIKEGTELSSKH